MPQVLKDEVRERIVGAALRVFADRGYAGATMTAIAHRARMGTASIYRYYASKRELFDAIVTPELALRFESLLDRRVRGLARAAMIETSRGTDDFGEEMLRFWVENRLAVVILLDRAVGSAYVGFGGRFVDRLVASTLASIREASPRPPVSSAARFVLARIFDNTRRALAAILEAHEDEHALREAIEGFWSYQIAGIRGFAAWMAAGAGARKGRTSPAGPRTR